MCMINLKQLLKTFVEDWFGDIQLLCLHLDGEKYYMETMLNQSVYIYRPLTTPYHLTRDQKNRSKATNEVRYEPQLNIFLVK